MNGKRSKKINKKAKELTIEWLKTLLNKEEAAKITKLPPNNLVYNRKGTAMSMPYSYKGIKRKLKKLKSIEHLTLKDI
jgi:urocanate hydratase